METAWHAFVAADLEGTLSDGEGWKGIGRYLVEHGRGGGYRRFVVAHLYWPIVVRARPGLRQVMRDRWLKNLARLFKNVPALELETMAHWVVEHELWPKRRTGVLTELLGRQADGVGLVLASGTYEPVLRAFAERLGAVALGTPLEMMDGRATGRLAAPVNTGAAKAERLGAFLDGRPLLAAYGDTEADVPMLVMSATPTAVVPDAGLRRVAVERGWRIISLGASSDAR